ncbi:MAG: phage holin family protein [Syntrophomonadaceae bacterium]|nr:phage holin family protein [Syntrophomonadaceae bacterium]
MFQAIVRFIVSALVLLLVSYFVPGMRVAGFWGARAAAAVIALIGYLIERLMGENVSPRSRGIVGFVIAAAVIYLAQFLIPSMLSVSIIGALLAAFVIGLIDAFVPTTIR